MKPSEDKADPRVWASYKKIVETADRHKYQWAKLSKSKFMEEAKKVIQIYIPHLLVIWIIFQGFFCHTNWAKRNVFQYHNHERTH